MALLRRVENVLRSNVTAWYTKHYGRTRRKWAVLGKKWAQNSRIGVFDKKGDLLYNAAKAAGRGDDRVQKEGFRTVRGALHQVVDHRVYGEACHRFDACFVGDVLSVGVDGVDRDA